MFNVSALLLDNALLKCFATEVVLFFQSHIFSAPYCSQASSVPLIPKANARIVFFVSNDVECFAEIYEGNNSLALVL